MTEFFGKTLGEAITKSMHNKKLIRHGNREPLTTKGRFRVIAPPLFWGPWVEVWAQFGVVGANADSHRATVKVSFETQSRRPSTFDVEIKGGDRLIRTIGPGSAIVTVTGNVATAIKVRAKSHLFPQQVIVTV